MAGAQEEIGGEPQAREPAAAEEEELQPAVVRPGLRHQPVGAGVEGDVGDRDEGGGERLAVGDLAHRAVPPEGEDRFAPSGGGDLPGEPGGVPGAGGGDVLDVEAAPAERGEDRLAQLRVLPLPRLRVVDQGDAAHRGYLEE